jgi:hypothetical protein
LIKQIDFIEVECVFRIILIKLKRNYFVIEHIFVPLRGFKYQVNNVKIRAVQCSIKGHRR